MYNELLQEANTNKNLENNKSQINNKIKLSNEELENKQNLLMLT